jgi:hypothetical protein
MLIKTSVVVAYFGIGARYVPRIISDNILFIVLRLAPEGHANVTLPFKNWDNLLGKQAFLGIPALLD